MPRIDKLTRQAIIGLIEDKPDISRSALKELIRPHHHPDIPSLIEKDLGALATQMQNYVRDGNGVRVMFAITNRERDHEFVNVDLCQDLQKVKAVFDKLKKEQKARDRSIEKARTAGRKLAQHQQIEMDFGETD